MRSERRSPFVSYTPRRIHGTGPTPCEYFFIGSQPGYEENRSGVVFSGKTGDELNRFLDGDGLPERRDVWLTNVHREYKGKDAVYTSEDLARDIEDVVRELQRVQPTLIVPMGRTAIRLFLGDVDVDDVQGICWRLPASDKWPFLDNCVVFPIVHPASAFHNPEMAAYVVSGFTQLAAYLAGGIAPRTLFDDPYPEPHYEEITTAESLRSVLANYELCRQTDQTRRVPIAIDTEGWPDRPWSLQFSFKPGAGYLLRANCRGLLKTFGEYLARNRPHLTYHSALHDLRMMRVLGLPTDLPFDDTMVAAYLLQLEPQGLKPLCSRHAGMKMQHYDELVQEPNQRLALDYISSLWNIEQLDYEQRCDDAFWVEIDKGRRISVLPKLPKTALHKATERAMRSKNTRNLWSNQVEDIQVDGYNMLGPMPIATLDHVPAKTAVDYGCRDADGTIRIAPALAARVDALKLREVYDLELATYPLIERMSYVGIKPDLPHFSRLSRRLNKEIGDLQSRLCSATRSESFNANSGDQVADYLFETLGLESIKDTRSGRGSTNDKVLEALEHEHPEFPIISTIRSYREVYKLKNTFVDRLPDFVRRFPYDGRVHATFRTTRVVTGRLAASEPNLLAMPKHGKFAKEFRRGWIAGDGHLLGSWDLSQIELRVAAHLSQDPAMLAIYRGERRNPDGSPIDLHAALAQRIFGVLPKNQDDSKHRLPAKAINFQFWMGGTYIGLQVELRKNGFFIDADDAQRWIDEAHALYTGAQPYMDAKAAEAEKNGFVRCLSGRIRYIGGIRSRDARVREEAKRFAFSTPIQEGAQLIMKTNEAVLWRDIIVPLQRQGRWIEPLLQIHDDLLLEMDAALVPEVAPRMVQCMTQSYKGLSVPIQTSSSAGPTWADLAAV